MPGFMSILQQGKSYAGRGMRGGMAYGAMGHQALGMLGRANRNTIYGAAAGGMYGGMSSDTSFLGGAAMGAGLGRYGGAAVRGGRLGRKNILGGRGGRAGVSPGMRSGSFGGMMGGAGYGALGQARRDYRSMRGMMGTNLRGNKAVRPAAPNINRWKTGRRPG